ncbi:LPXTG cell wall anchor domain-containing protein [Enterococcus dongliensis]|uniref:LPXTG cell wall anchor domain-containing protein n=1 Tax=Enterococcus dongliensis TaxID=2559925 RepID=A0AAP5KPP7_9ENTE|nr:LPXTG cell wall anchor domain-containing protein [Enterococcus dongliensis]MDT2595668.1 LPXTG cell wall anchor domain-containing protein [Enterococcus dongliensis]MDT2602628.1 LPXTG cell wall anchor domain-containing protein [Enterococcus dongliensis]MDT2633884.1 LPXTG cell wall anchor domain-containing protein [Enterococcus dongliensis]MDT2636280.1 LPXTG cell wall anchor domain-containing protein [Enterococcus dongliensis]MDT2641502.1 LPXTG cell wall anchor domain-containing protein [Enter
MKKILLKGGLVVCLLFAGWQPVYASESVDSTTTITFYDPSPVPKPNPPTSDISMGTTKNQLQATANSNKMFPQTNDKPMNYLLSLIGGELIFLGLIIVWKRKKEEEDDEQKNTSS